jgi:predicted Zn-dependent protease
VFGGEAAGAPDPNAFDAPEDRLEALRDSLREKRVDVEAIGDCIALLEAARLEPSLRKRVLLSLAVALHVDLKRPMAEVAQVLPMLARLHRAVPGLAFPQLYLGRYFFRVGEYERALDQLSEIPGSLGRRPVVMNMLGRCREKLSQFDDAERAYRESLAQKGEQPTILFALGRLLLARYRRSVAEPNS